MENETIHRTSRWLKNGKVRTRCRESVWHRFTDTSPVVKEVNCEVCLRLMARDKAKKKP